MIEKIIGPGIELLSDLWPGWKTKIVGAMAVGMAICESSKLLWDYGHAFDAMTWSAIPMGASLTIAIRKYHEMQGELTKMKESSK